MTGPHDPNHDLQESVPTVLTVFGRYTPSFTGWPGAPVTRAQLPFGWGPIIDPERGVLIGHLVRTDLPRLGPADVLRAAAAGEWGFRTAEDAEGDE